MPLNRMWLLIIALMYIMGGPLEASAQQVAQTRPATPIDISAQPDGVYISWRLTPAQRQHIREDVLGLPFIDVHGWQVPGQLVALQVNHDGAVEPQFTTLTSAASSERLARNTAPVSQTSSGEARPALSARATSALPAAPVVVLRDATMRGVRIVVLLVTPFFAQDGRQRAVVDLQAVVPGATLFTSNAAILLNISTPFVANAPAPTNAVANNTAAVIRVAQEGIQQVSGATLAFTSLDLSDTTRLHLYHNGTETALEVRDGGDGKLDPADTLRFFAGVPGDRWNATDSYWLAVETTPGLRMASRAAGPGEAAVSDTAFQSGTWRNNKLYDSTLPGPDGDHWFSTDLRTGPDLSSMSTMVVLSQTLPPGAGEVALTINGSAYTAGQHQLAVASGIANIFLPVARVGIASATKTPNGPEPQQSASPTMATWSGIGNGSKTFPVAAPLTLANITLVTGDNSDGVEIDSVGWRQPVSLGFRGKGALFETDAGAAQYRLSNTAADRTLYDVTNPAVPVVLAIPDGTTTTFQDTPEAHRYALTGAGVLQTPTVTNHTPVDLSLPPNVDALYVAPASFGAALAPLVAQRQAQGYSARAVDVQAIYDTWSFGQISPEAIRSFARFAATGSRAPQAMTLVGDGTIDPFNYTNSNRNGFNNNVNIVPPYTAMADPYAGETACDTCYGLLDGNDPLADGLPDLAVGRLPVKTPAELERLVKKLVVYENAPRDAAQPTRNIYVADNYREVDGTADTAGDFAAAADQSIALQPKNTTITRMYFDPFTTHNGVPWREADATAAAQRTRSALNAGAEVFNYFGHSNQYQIAVTNSDGPGPGYLLSLYDADGLSNTTLPVMLQMTCLTSAFQTPALSGTTIDERLLLAAHGAAAVWGSTGRGVSFGHDSLQRGFYEALWQGNQAQVSKPVGALTMAGYQTLFAHGICCQETIDTYVLLGDPLTPLRVSRGN